MYLIYLKVKLSLKMGGSLKVGCRNIHKTHRKDGHVGVAHIIYRQRSTLSEKNHHMLTRRVPQHMGNTCQRNVSRKRCVFVRL